MFKFGASHMIRGRSLTGVFDTGSLAAEIAVLEGGRALHVLLAPGAGSRQAAFDAPTYRYGSVAADTLAEQKWSLLAPPPGGGHSVIDLRPLRPAVGRGLERAAPELSRAIHGYDLAVVLDRTTASENLV